MIGNSVNAALLPLSQEEDDRLLTDVIVFEELLPADDELKLLYYLLLSYFLCESVSHRPRPDHQIAQQPTNTGHSAVEGGRLSVYFGGQQQKATTPPPVVTNCSLLLPKTKLCKFAARRSRPYWPSILPA